MGVTCALGQSHVPLDCVPHICSSQVAPGGLGKCLLHKHSTEITAPLPGACPAQSFHISSHLPKVGGQPPQVGPAGSAMEIYRVPLPPSSPVISKNSCPGSWDAQLVPSGLGPNTSSWASFLGFLRMAPPSSGRLWSFPSNQGRVTLD